MAAGKYRLVQGLLWIVFYLALIDIGVNIFLRFPMDPQKTPPSFLREYFEYGRSAEGKLDRMSRLTDGQPAPILEYGWFKNKDFKSLPNKVSENQTLVAVYGMSHIKLLGEAIAKIDRKYVIRHIAAPGAPVNWSFAAYEADKDRHEAKVVILGIMTDSVPYLSATAGTTSYFDMSHPYTFPRCFVKDNQLIQIYPPFFTAEGFREYFYDSEKWGEYRDWLAKNDKFYDPFLFKRSLTDNSALLRVFRRAYSDMLKKRKISDVYTRKGFNSKCEEVMALHAIVREFSRSAKERNSLPIIYIVNNEGRGDHLYKVLKPILDGYKIAYLSTHIICPPDNPRVFTGINSHFIPSKDMELAREMIKIIKIERERGN